MSHFYATIRGHRGPATRQGTKSSGVTAVAASWGGCVRVRMSYDDRGRDVFRVEMAPWEGKGDSLVLATGRAGDATSVQYGPGLPNSRERSALRALVALAKGVFDDPDLAGVGPLFPDLRENVIGIAEGALR